MVDNCEYCADAGGMYDMEKRCCRARFTAQTGHGRKRRQAWCEYWRKTLPEDEANATIEAARQLYEARKSGTEVANYGQLCLQGDE